MKWADESSDDDWEWDEAFAKDARLDMERRQFVATFRMDGMRLKNYVPDGEQHVPLGVLDKDVLLAAVSDNGNALQFVPPDARDDEEIVLAAISSEGRSLRYAPMLFRERFDIVTLAVGCNPNAFEFASENLKSDRELALRAALSGDSFEYAHDDLKTEIRKEADELSMSVRQYAESQLDCRVLAVSITFDDGDDSLSVEALSMDGNVAAEICFRRSEFSVDSLRGRLKNELGQNVHLLTTSGTVIEHRMSWQELLAP